MMDVINNTYDDINGDDGVDFSDVISNNSNRSINK